MEKYFYSNDNQKNGPYLFEELKNENIRKDTLIWYKGLENWTLAGELVEMISILELNPPEINQNFIENELNNNPTIETNNTEKSINIKKRKQRLLSKPFSFEGRIRRTEFCISLIIYFIAYLFVLVIIKSIDVPFMGLAFTPMLWFLWAQGAKRCHDIGNSGWYQIIPFYMFWMLFANGQKETNQYGINPKI